MDVTEELWGRNFTLRTRCNQRDLTTIGESRWGRIPSWHSSVPPYRGTYRYHWSKGLKSSGNTSRVIFYICGVPVRVLNHIEPEIKDCDVVCLIYLCAITTYGFCRKFTVRIHPIYPFSTEKWLPLCYSFHGLQLQWVPVAHLNKTVGQPARVDFQRRKGNGWAVQSYQVLLYLWKYKSEMPADFLDNYSTALMAHDPTLSFPFIAIVWECHVQNFCLECPNPVTSSCTREDIAWTMIFEEPVPWIYSRTTFCRNCMHILLLGCEEPRII